VNNGAGARVLHLVPPNGGGVDRFVRDLCAHRPADWLVHVSQEQCVVEGPDSDLMAPIALADLPGLAGRGALGRAGVLHAHSTRPAVRGATTLLASAMQTPYVVTLHDVEVAGPPDAPDPLERAQRLEFIRGAARCTVPSRYMAGVAVDILGPSFHCTVVENGVDRRPVAVVGQGTRRFAVAVIGAMGKHKGLDHLIEVATLLPADMGVVLLGYADGALGPGWLGDGKVWVHGAFEPTQLPQLVADYGSVVAFFPKGQPESFCYALSDAWLAGLPVVGPDSGAIGERVRAHGGGTLYDPQAPAADVAVLIGRQVEQSAVARSRIGRAVQSLSSVATMVEAMNRVYAEVSVPAAEPDLEALKKSTAAHLDSKFFRQELLRLQGDLGAAIEQRDNALRELQALAGNFGKRGEWIDHLQKSNDELQQECRNLLQSAATLGAELDRLQLRSVALEALQAEHAGLLRAYADLKAGYDRLLRPLTWPLRLMPVAARSWVVKTAKRIFIEGRNG
jgi:glycosyltransferase involved in cell wall biosynthesis